MILLLLASLTLAAAPLPQRAPIPNGTEVRALTLRYVVLEYLPDAGRYRVQQYRQGADGGRHDEDVLTVPAGYLEGHYYEGWDALP